MEDFRCKERYVEMMVSESKLLKHANKVYTIGAYRLFEKYCMKFPEYYQGLLAISDKYIFKRWTKHIDFSLSNSSVGDVGKISKKNIAKVGFSNIKNLVGRYAKGEHNIRKKLSR
ncbi:hypothetical protein M9H77_09655 [Catharanthus roseus]|uniref:Uncharacterized protein n=1 Tax=Catharanthus roseus TaxID=4058 RepID=A0ACC0C1E5_CATRO|nr:hypothetical protein M9H77_09655 [Catharanthus roseus]